MDYKRSLTACIHKALSPLLPCLMDIPVFTLIPDKCVFTDNFLGIVIFAEFPINSHHKVKTITCQVAN